MSDMEREELIQRALAMSKEERLIVLESFPAEDLFEVLYRKYFDLMSKCEAVQGILTGGN